MAKRKSVKKKTTSKGPSKVAELTSLRALLGMDDSEWEATEAAEGGGVPFPAGRSQSCLIQSAEVCQSQSGNPMIKWVLKGIGETNEGCIDFENSMLITPQNRSFARRQIEAISLEWPNTAVDLGETVKEAEGLEIIVDVVDKDDYHNIYFTDVVDGDGDGKGDSQGDDSGDYTKADIKALGKAADDDDGGAIDELEGLAGECKLVSDDYDTWEALASAVMEELNL